MTALDKILDWKLGTNTNNNATGFLVTSDDFKDGQQELASLRSENERLKALTTWQPIDENTPPLDKILIGKYIDGQWNVAHFSFVTSDYYGCTHWMPLPKPPEEQK